MPDKDFSSGTTSAALPSAPSSFFLKEAKSQYQKHSPHKEVSKGYVCDSVVKHLPNVCEPRGLVSCSAKKREEGRREGGRDMEREGTEK